ncbi:MAG: hypothetical protein ABW173_01985, partial [Sphingomonas sp.]
MASGRRTSGNIDQTVRNSVFAYVLDDLMGVVQRATDGTWTSGFDCDLTLLGNVITDWRAGASRNRANMAHAGPFTTDAQGRPKWNHPSIGLSNAQFRRATYEVVKLADPDLRAAKGTSDPASRPA